MAKRQYIQIPVATSATSGDPARKPLDRSEFLRNVVSRPGRLEARYGWKSDGTANLNTADSYAIWDDIDNNAQKLIGIKSNGRFCVKTTSTEAWGSEITGWTSLFSTDPVIDYANLNGTLFVVNDDTVSVVQKYDGTTAEEYTPSLAATAPVGAKTLASWINRLFIGNCNTLANRGSFLNGTAAYCAGWSVTNGALTTTVSTGATTISFQPSAGSGTVETYLANAISIQASESATPFYWRAMVRGESDSYRVPLTVLVYVSSIVGRTTAYVVGEIRRDPAGGDGRFRCTTAGTTAGAAPAYTLTEGATTTDGTTVWTCLGSATVAKGELDVPSVSDTTIPTTIAVKGTLPAMPSALTLGLAFRYGTDARTSWDQVPIAISFRDGKTDGDPTKDNFGQHAQPGSFVVDFHNTEATASTVDLSYPQRVWFSQPGDPSNIPPENYIDFYDVPGNITAVRAINADLLAIFKRNAILTVRPGPSDRVPIVRGDLYRGVGAIHARGIDFLDGITFFIGEHDVYAWDGVGDPRGICGDDMREEIMERGATWIEDASADEFPTLRVNVKHRELWVMTQTKKIYVYSIDRKSWTHVEVVSDAIHTTSVINDFIFFNNKMYVAAATNGVVREDSSAVRDEIYNAGSPVGYSVNKVVWLHPIESIPRKRVLIEEVVVRGQFTGTQANSTLQAAISFDGGVTFAKSHTVTPNVSTGGVEECRIPVWQAADSLTIRLRHTGDIGPSYFNITEAGAWVQVRGKRAPTPENPTTTAVSL